MCGVCVSHGPQACSSRRVLWVNLREEPVLYVLGRPYVLRNLVVPFANLEYTGIDTERVHDMERRLKEEVLADAAQNEGRCVLCIPHRHTSTHTYHFCPDTQRTR